MGNTNEQPQQQLTFVQVLEDKYFGEVEIYRSTEGLFIVKICRTLIAGDKRHLELLRIMEIVIQEKLNNIVRILHFNRFQEKSICIKYEKVDIYTQYYNFTLQDLLSTKKQLEQTQLWFILLTLLNLVIILKQYQIIPIISLRNIFLTPTGIPCIYHYHLSSIRQSIVCSQFTIGQDIAKIMMQLMINIKLDKYNQEELIEEEVLYGRMIEKYKIMGKIVKEMIRKEKNQMDVWEEIKGLERKEIISVGVEVKLLKFKYCLPDHPQFLNLPALSKIPSSTSKIQNSNEIGTTLTKSTIKNPIKPNPNPPIQPRNKTQYTQDSILKQKKSSQANQSINSSSKKQDNLYKTKEETTKMLSDLDKKKEQYRIQMQKFKIRKQQLLSIGSGKQNEVGIRQRRQSQKKKDTQSSRRKIDRFERFR